MCFPPLRDKHGYKCISVRKTTFDVKQIWWWVSGKIHKGQFIKSKFKTEVNGAKEETAPVWAQDMKSYLIRLVFWLSFALLVSSSQWWWLTTSRVRNYYLNGIHFLNNCGNGHISCCLSLSVKLWMLRLVNSHRREETR